MGFIRRCPWVAAALLCGLTEAATARGLALLPAGAAEDHATHGVSADFGGRSVVVGKHRFVAGQAAGTLEQLRRLGIRGTLLPTGDAAETAGHVAGEVGMSRVRAECLPADKVEEASSLPPRPAMTVGDGVNDAPALAPARSRQDVPAGQLPDRPYCGAPR